MLFRYNQKFVAFDFESEGLNLRYSKPWQLSWVYYEGNVAKEEFDYFIDIPNLENTLDPLVKRLTRFDPDKYNRLKKSPKEVYDKFIKFIRDPSVYTIGQNNLNFDIYMLQNLCDMVGEDLEHDYMERSIDTVALGRAYREGLPTPKKADFITWQHRILNDPNLKSKASLPELCKILGVKYDKDKHHDALNDVKYTWEIFVQLRKRMKL